MRWLKFNAVGATGVAVQLVALAICLKLGLHYLLATALAVEFALLHNYFWHRRWTWRDRPAAGALLRFHLANGLVSIVSNMLWMRLFVGTFGLPHLPANLASIAITSLINFALGDRWVFSTRPERAPSRL